MNRPSRDDHRVMHGRLRRRPGHARCGGWYESAWSMLWTYSALVRRARHRSSRRADWRDTPWGHRCCGCLNQAKWRRPARARHSRRHGGGPTNRNDDDRASARHRLLRTKCSLARATAATASGFDP